MAGNQDRTRAEQRDAGAIFAAWLRSGTGGFEKLCREHPEQAGELQKLQAIFELGRAAVSSRSFQQSLREQFGEDAEVTVKLEEAVPFVASSSGGPEDEPAEAGATSKAGRYTLEDEVARGGMGVIFRVRDRDLSRTLAMKVMTGGPVRVLESGSGSKLGLARFLEEAQVTAQLDHPGIVPVHEVGFDTQGQPFFTMKLVKGRDLNEIFKLARAGEGWSEPAANKVGRVAPRAPLGVPPSGGPDRVNAGHQTADGAHGVTRPTQQSSQTEPENWNLPRAVGAVVKACQALAYAHTKGVIHRDLKPANIMVGRFGEVFVMDWGLAKITGKKDLHDIRPKDTQLTSASLHSPRHDDAASTPDSPLITMDGSVVGTPAYMAPEQAKGQVEQVDAFSDIYSLGAILYNLLTGQAPYVEPGTRISPHTILARVLDGPPKRIHTLNSKAPAELTAICEKAMARDKRDRYASSLDLAEDLQAYLDNRVVKAYRTGAVAEFKSWVARNKGLALTAAAAVVLAGAGVSLVIWQQKQGNERLRRNLYVADMNVAQQALAENNVGHALALVRKYFPKPGEADLRGFEWRYLWQLCQGDEIFSSSASDSIVTCVAFSPDGKFLATAGFDKRVTILDLTSRKSVAMFGPFDDVLWRNALIFSPNGKILAITDGDKVSLCETATWRKLDRMLECEALGHANASARPVAFSPDGYTLAVKTAAGIQLWDTATWKPKGQITGEPKVFGAMFAFSPDGALLAVGTSDRIILWDLNAQSELSDFQCDIRSPACWAFSAKGDLLAAGNYDGDVVLCDLARRRVLKKWRAHKNIAFAVALSPDGKTLATGGGDQLIHLWDVKTLERLSTLRGHRNEVWALAFSPDGQTLASASKDGTMKIWNGVSQLEKPEMAQAKAPLWFSPDGKTLLAADTDNVVRYWNLESKQVTRSVALGPEPIKASAISSDGKIAALARGMDSVEIWNLETGKCTATNRLDRPDVRRLAISPDGRLLASAAASDWTGKRTGSVRIMDIASGREVAVWQDAYNPVLFSPDGKMIAAAGPDHTAKLWELATPDKFTSLKGHHWEVYSLAFSPDSKWLVTGGVDNTARVWDFRTKREVAVLRGHYSGVHVVAFSPDGQTIATGSTDQTVRLWNAHTHQPLLTLREYREDIDQVFFSPDGNTLVAGGLQSTSFANFQNARPLQLWHAPTFSEIESMEKTKSGWR